MRVSPPPAPASRADRHQLDEGPAGVRSGALPEPEPEPNSELAPSPLAETSRLEDLARRMAKSIDNPGEARALAGRVPGLTAEERAQVFTRWAELRGVPLEQPAPSTATTPPSPRATVEPSTPTHREPQENVNIPASLIGALQPVDLHVLVTILAYARKRSTFPLALSDIERTSGIARSTLLRSLGRLEASGQLAREQTDGKENTYTVTVPKAPQFIRIPVDLLGALDSEALAQYLALRAICGRFSTCARSVAELAARAGLSVRAARQALARLQDAGLLTIRRHLYRESTYRVLSGVVPNLTGGSARSGRG